MADKNTKKKISTLQWLVIGFFTLALIGEISTYINPASWVIRNDQILNWQYWYLFLPFLLNPVGLYGLYKITKFDRKGFHYFYLSFASSTVLDYLRATHFIAGTITILGNLLLFLLFHFVTRKIKRASS